VKRLVTPILAIAVFALAATLLLQRARQVGYNTDEGQFISTAQYFELVFLDRSVAGPPWEETYWTLTQPPITRYVLGGAIWLSGNPIPRVDLEHRIEEVRGPNRERFLDPRTFEDEDKLAEDRRIERPRSEVLHAARVPMALFGAGAVLLLLLVGNALAGPAAGLVASLGLLWAPLTMTLLPRAHAEAPLLFFILLGLYLGVLAARRVREGDGGRAGAASSAPTGVLTGIAIGFGAATKLPAVLGIAALGAFAVWSFVIGRTRLGRAFGSAWRWSALAAVLGLLVSIAINPFLWPDPVGRTYAMLQFRQQELVGQRTLNLESAVPENLAVRSALLLERTFVGEMPIARRTGLPLDAILAVIGTVALGWRALRDRAAGGLIGPETLALAWIATFLAGTAPNLGLDWQRYYLPTVGLGLVLVGVGAETLLGWLLRAIRTSRRAPSSRPTAPPPMTTAKSGSAG
jgi:hypothetical protein